MTPLHQKLMAIIEEAGKATPGPWEPMENPERKVCYILSPKGILDHDISYSGQRIDLEFIASSRANVPRLARALVRAVEALELCAKPSLSRRATEEINIREALACNVLDEIEKEFE